MRYVKNLSGTFERKVSIWKVGYIRNYPREIVAKIDFSDFNMSVYQLFTLIVDR